MASSSLQIQILKCSSSSSLSPFFMVSNSRRKLCGRKVVSNFQNHWNPQLICYRSSRVYCKVQGDDNPSIGEEPPESLFMKELKKRGMTPISLVEESNRSIFGDEEMTFKEEEGGYSKRNAVTADYEESSYNQSERSMSLNSEGPSSSPKGSIPGAELLLLLGGTFFSTFWRLILITVASFFALYLFFGSAFVHDGSAITLPQYINPYALLEDEMTSQTASLVN